MATTVLAWTAGDVWRIAELDDRSEILIGRDDAATIRLEQPTVSRRHARVTCTDGQCVVENLSGTNPSRRNETTILEPTTLRDGDRLTLGDAQVVFHDLRARDSVSGLVCSNCGRENDPGGKDCWFCGTSLVNASSSTRMRHDVVCRVIVTGGGSHDVRAGEALTLRADGQAESESGLPAETTSATVVVWAEDKVVLRPGSGAAVTLNGVALSSERTLATGDLVAVAEGLFTVVVR